jgi:hypothetical protein
MRQYTMLAVGYQSNMALQKVEDEVEDLQVRAPAFEAPYLDLGGIEI